MEIKEEEEYVDDDDVVVVVENLTKKKKKKSYKAPRSLASYNQSYLKNLTFISLYVYSVQYILIIYSCIYFCLCLN